MLPCGEILVQVARGGSHKGVAFKYQPDKVKEPGRPTCDKRGSHKCKGPDVGVCPTHSEQQGEGRLLSFPFYRRGTEDQSTEVTCSRSPSKKENVPGLEPGASDTRPDGSTEISVSNCCVPPGLGCL